MISGLSCKIMPVDELLLGKLVDDQLAIVGRVAEERFREADQSRWASVGTSDLERDDDAGEKGQVDDDPIE